MLVWYLALFQLSLLRLTSPYSYDPYNNKGEYKDNVAPLSNYIIPLSKVPFLVLIAYKNKYCSGVLVKSRIVVTAASCFLPGYEKVVVKVGASSVPSFGQVINVLEVKTHEYFKHYNPLDNDIAMVMLEENVIFGPDVKKAVLPKPDSRMGAGTVIGVSGWGSTNLKQIYVHKILYSEMVVLDNAVCQSNFGKLMSSSNFCARYQSDRGLSDNGGPAIYKDLLVGIVSYGVWDKQEPFIAIFTNVSYFHRWITTNSDLFLKRYCRPGDK